jgi:hypothetical protein
MSSGRVKTVSNDVRRPSPRHAAALMLSSERPHKYRQLLPLLLHINEFLPLIKRNHFPVDHGFIWKSAERFDDLRISAAEIVVVPRRRIMFH